MTHKLIISIFLSAFLSCICPAYSQPSYRQIYSKVKANLVRNYYVDSASAVKHFEYTFSGDDTLLQAVLINGCGIVEPWDADGIYMSNTYGYRPNKKQRLNYFSGYLYSKDSAGCNCNFSPQGKREYPAYSNESLSYLGSVFNDIRIERENKRKNRESNNESVFNYSFDKNIFTDVIEMDTCKILEITYNNMPCYKIISEKSLLKKFDREKFELQLNRGDYSRYAIAFGLNTENLQDSLENMELRSLAARYADSKVYSLTEQIICIKDYAILKYTHKIHTALTDGSLYKSEIEESFAKQGKKYIRNYAFYHGNCFGRGTFYNEQGLKGLLLILPSKEKQEAMKPLFPQYVYENICERKIDPDAKMLEGLLFFKETTEESP